MKSKRLLTLFGAVAVSVGLVSAATYAMYEQPLDNQLTAVRYDQQLDVVIYVWRQAGMLHRTDGPARVLVDPATMVATSEEWWQHDKLHREGRPALIERDAATGIVTREEWWQKGKLHREDGPAVTFRSEVTGNVLREEWWREGVHVARPQPTATVTVNSLP
jgi:hypothetical protein